MFQTLLHKKNIWFYLFSFEIGILASCTVLAPLVVFLGNFQNISFYFKIDKKKNKKVQDSSFKFDIPIEKRRSFLYKTMIKKQTKIVFEEKMYLIVGNIENPYYGIHFFLQSTTTTTSHSSTGYRGREETTWTTIRYS